MNYRAQAGGRPDEDLEAPDDAITIGFWGRRLALGKGPGFYGIWDQQASGRPVARFPKSPDGWQEACPEFTAAEPDPRKVPGREAVPATAGGETGAETEAGHPVVGEELAGPSTPGSPIGAHSRRETARRLVLSPGGRRRLALNAVLLLATVGVAMTAWLVWAEPTVSEASADEAIAAVEAEGFECSVFGVPFGRTESSPERVAFCQGEGDAFATVIRFSFVGEFDAWAGRTCEEPALPGTDVPGVLHVRGAYWAVALPEDLEQTAEAVARRLGGEPVVACG